MKPTNNVIIYQQNSTLLLVLALISFTFKKQVMLIAFAYFNFYRYIKDNTHLLDNIILYTFAKSGNIIGQFEVIIFFIMTAESEY